SVPAVLAASALPHVMLPDMAPTLADALASARTAPGVSESLPEALINLIGAEAEALHVAGLGLQQPTPADLASRANHAGARVLDAVTIYVRSAQAVLHT